MIHYPGVPSGIRYLALILLTATLQLSCKNSDTENRICILPEEISSDSATIFAPGLISTHLAERDAALSPNGDEFYFTVTSYIHPVIVYSIKNPEGWTEPQVASFSGTFSDLEPHFLPDGQRLFFASNRPLREGEEPKDFDIWYVDRNNNGWSEPVNIGSPVNTEANEFYPSITNNGTLYWCAIRKDGTEIGGEDIYYSSLEQGKYQKVHVLSDSINTTRDEFNAYVARDESYIIFTSNGWGQGYGRGDLWISFKYPNGHWTKAKNMGEKLNSPSFEFCPFVSDCGKYLFFTSDRLTDPGIQPADTYRQILDFSQKLGNKQNNIYVIDANILSLLRQECM
jgi:Tol biopolymer transport system component